MQPVALPIWICGLWFFFVNAEGKSYRALGCAYLGTLLILLLVGGRFYYLAPAYPMLLACGAVAMEGWFARRRSLWLKWGYLSLLAVTGGALALNTLPLLPPKIYIRYTHLIGLSQPKFEHR